MPHAPYDAEHDGGRESVAALKKPWKRESPPPQFFSEWSRIGQKGCEDGEHHAP